MLVTKQEILQDLRFIIYRDIIKTQTTTMQQYNFKHEGIKTSFSDLSQTIINDGLKALDLLAFNNGRTVTTKDGKVISLNNFIKNLIETEGVSKSIEKMEKLLTSDRIDREAKLDLQTYIKLQYIAEDAINLISDLSIEDLNNEILIRQLEGLERSDSRYRDKLKLLSQNALGNDIYKKFPLETRASLGRNLVFTFAVHTEKQKNEELSIANLENRVKLEVNNEMLLNILNSYLDLPKQGFTVEIKDEIYKTLNKSKYGTDFAINQESRNNFVQQLVKDSEQSGFNVDPQKSPKKIQMGWRTYQSWNLLGGEKFNSGEISHRFYIPVRPDKMYEVAHLLYNKYREKNIPFYFKIVDETDAKNNIVSRKDNVVVYTTNNYLQDNLDIMSALEKECKALENCDEVSQIQGKLTNRIGYATEIANAKTSYTGRISDAISKAIEKLSTDKINDTISYDKYKEQCKAKVKELLKNNPNLIFDEIKHQMTLNGLDINNICCDAEVMKSLNREVHQVSANTEL